MSLNAAGKQEKNAGLALGEMRLKAEMVVFPGDERAEAIDRKCSLKTFHHPQTELWAWRISEKGEQ